MWNNRSKSPRGSGQIGQRVILVVLLRAKFNIVRVLRHGLRPRLTGGRGVHVGQHDVGQHIAQI